MKYLLLILSLGLPGTVHALSSSGIIDYLNDRFPGSNAKKSLFGNICAKIEGENFCNSKKKWNGFIEDLQRKDEVNQAQTQQQINQNTANNYIESDDSLAQTERDPFAKMNSMSKSVADEKSGYALEKVSLRLLTCDDTWLGVSEVAESNGELFLRAGVGFFDEFDRFAAVTPANVLKGAADKGIQMNEVFVPFLTANTIVNNTPLKTVVQKKQGASVFYARSETTIMTGADYGKPLVTEVFYDFDNSRIIYTKRDLKGDSRCNLATKNAWISR